VTNTKLIEPFHWDEKSDVWGVGCILMELYTGELLFPTSSTYEHLAMIEKISGNFY
jgi:dual-specificity kinase